MGGIAGLSELTRALVSFVHKAYETTAFTNRQFDTVFIGVHRDTGKTKLPSLFHVFFNYYALRVGHCAYSRLCTIVHRICIIVKIESKNIDFEYTHERIANKPGTRNPWGKSPNIEGLDQYFASV